jgi:hypothetical protein
MVDKTLDVISEADLKKKVNDSQVVGNTDMWQLISKASSKEQGWMKSTKALFIPDLGVVIQVSTQQGDNVAEALVFVPGAIIKDTKGIKTIVADPDLF